MNYRRLLGALISLALAGCATLPPESSPEASHGNSELATQNITSIEQFLREHRPRGSQPVFLGVATRLRNRDDEEQNAVVHVAEQASRYIRMAARYQVVSQQSGRSLGVRDDIRAEWDVGLAERLVGSVEVLQMFQDQEGTYILGTVAGIPPLPDLNLETTKAENPFWVHQPPEIPGYIVTTGVSLRSRRIRDSIDSADQEALKEILSQTRSSVRMLENRREVGGQGTTMNTTVAQEASATLHQFLVIARHTSADGRYYYSLVIAREE